MSYEKKTNYTTQFSNGQDQLRESTTEHLTITYGSKDSHEAGDRLRAGEELLPGDQLTSGNSRFCLQVQSNGNAVVISHDGGDVAWSSNTGGKGVRAFRLTHTGNVEAVSADGQVTWATNTSSARKTELVMQDDGNLVLYADQAPIWASNTEK